MKLKKLKKIELKLVIIFYNVEMKEKLKKLPEKARKKANLIITNKEVYLVFLLTILKKIKLILHNVPHL